MVNFEKKLKIDSFCSLSYGLLGGDFIDLGDGFKSHRMTDRMNLVTIIDL